VRAWEYKSQFIVSISDNTTKHNGNLSGFAFLKPLSGPTIYLISFKTLGICKLYSENVSAVYFHCYALFAVKQLARDAVRPRLYLLLVQD
jgi:hypothetical protein